MGIKASVSLYSLQYQYLQGKMNLEEIIAFVKSLGSDGIELLRGAPIGDALRFANACGAICASAVGAGTALKNRSQVLDLAAKELARQAL